MSTNFRSWFERLPQGGKVLIVLVGALIAGSLLFASGARIGETAYGLFGSEQEETARG